MSKISDKVEALAWPVVEEEGCKLWSVEYIKEAGTWYLRVYIDKDGGVGITDCEAISRKLDPTLDEADPVPGSYVFEVGSAGAERELKRPSDFERYLGEPILVKLYRPKNGQKEFPCRLLSYHDGDVTAEMGGRELTFDKAEIALVRLRVEF